MNQPNSILIKNGTVVLGPSAAINDVLIKNEKISAVGELAGCSADQTIDAEGLLVLPGAIDPHIHFNEHNKGHIGVHDYYTGSRAAAFGGTTSVVDFSDQIHGQPLINVIKVKQQQAEGKALIDWNVHPIISQVTPELLDEVPALIEAGAPTFKCFMTYRSMSGESAVNMYSGQPGRFITDKEFTDLSQRLTDAGGMLMVHAEDSNIIDKNALDMMKNGLTKAHHHAQCRPPESESNAIERILNVARATGGRIFIVHLSSEPGLNVLAHARSQGLNVYAETTPHYLIFTDEKLKRDDGYKWLGSPPIRDQKTQNALWRGVIDGRISMVATDDCAFSLDSKLAGAQNFDKCPEGIPGIEPRLTVLYSEGVAKGRISLPRLVELTATNPARLFGMYPKKGSLNPGADADIVLFDPTTKWTMNQNTLHMASDYCAYDDVKVTGKVNKVFSRGQLIIDGENCLAQKGRGQYIHCQLDKHNFASI
ncbi:MAG: dihydropyrimidinase [Planctomycetes bacterium]|nr:dihydropyrimidinase [Planctomycetota bacterium]